MADRHDHRSRPASHGHQRAHVPPAADPDEDALLASGATSDVSTEPGPAPVPDTIPETPAVAPAPVEVDVAALFAEDRMPDPVEVEPAAPPSASTMPEAPPPSLPEAFFTLCRSMEGHLLDNLPAHSHCREIQAWAVNAGPDAAGRAQAIQAWRHAIMLLEGILGQKLGAG